MYSAESNNSEITHESLDMCMRPTYKSPAEDITLAESYQDEILPVIEHTMIGQEYNMHSVLSNVDEDEKFNGNFDEKDYDFYSEEKTEHYEDDEKNLYYDDEKMELMKKEQYFDDEDCKHEKEYKDEKNEEDQWVLPESELGPSTRSRYWSKRRVITSIAALYAISLGASYTYFYHGSSCM